MSYGGLLKQVTGSAVHDMFHPNTCCAQDYINWLKQQRIGPVYIDLTGRTDATEAGW